MAQLGSADARRQVRLALVCRHAAALRLAFEASAESSNKPLLSQDPINRGAANLEPPGDFAGAERSCDGSMFLN